MQGLFPQLEPALPAGGRYVRVAVERGIEAGGPDGDGLTYPAGEDVQVGQRVDVPLGRGDKRASGIVVSVGGAELLEGLRPSKVKAGLGTDRKGVVEGK